MTLLGALQTLRVIKEFARTSDVVVLPSHDYENSASTSRAGSVSTKRLREGMLRRQRLNFFFMEIYNALSEFGAGSEP